MKRMISFIHVSTKAVMCHLLFQTLHVQETIVSAREHKIEFICKSLKLNAQDLTALNLYSLE